MRYLLQYISLKISNFYLSILILFFQVQHIFNYKNMQNMIADQKQENRGYENPIYSRNFTLPSPSQLMGLYADSESLGQIMPALQQTFLVVNLQRSQIMHIHYDGTIIETLQIADQKLEIHILENNEAVIIENVDLHIQKQQMSNPRKVIRIRIWDLVSNFVKQCMIETKKEYIFYEKSRTLAIYQFIQNTQQNVNRRNQRNNSQYNLQLSYYRIPSSAENIELEFHQNQIMSNNEKIDLQKIYSIQYGPTSSTQVMKANQISAFAIMQHKYYGNQLPIIYFAPQIQDRNSISEPQIITLDKDSLFPKKQIQSPSYCIKQVFQASSELIYFKLQSKPSQGQRSSKLVYNTAIKWKSIMFNKNTLRITPLNVQNQYHNIQFVNNFRSFAQYKLSMKQQFQISIPFCMLNDFIMFPVYYVYVHGGDWTVLGKYHRPKTGILVGITSNKIVYALPSNEKIDIQIDQVKWGIFDRKQSVTFFLSSAMQHCDDDLIDHVLKLMEHKQNEQL